MRPGGRGRAANLNFTPPARLRRGADFKAVAAATVTPPTVPGRLPQAPTVTAATRIQLGPVGLSLTRMAAAVSLGPGIPGQ
jgi:hypothetical protein